MRTLLAVVILGLGPTLAHADRPTASSCYAELAHRNIKYKRISRKGISLGVAVTGPLGGIAFTSSGQPLDIDCSLAISLDEAGPYMARVGITEASFSSAYSRRNVRGTNKPSKHSFGLAIDVHTFLGAPFGRVRVDRDYEQGLGDDVNCLGTPLTQAGAVLKVLQCELVRSGLFFLVLSPDYDDAHWNHFHLEARPWGERESLRSTKMAIH